MKRTFLLLALSLITVSLSAQIDEYEKYLDSVRNEKNKMYQDYKTEIQQVRNEYEEYKAKQNAEFAEFIAKEWALFEDYKEQEFSMTKPKIKDLPKAPESEITETEVVDLNYKQQEETPEVSDIESINDGDELVIVPRNDNYVLRKYVTDSGVKEIKSLVVIPSASNKVVTTGQEISINFYGKKLDFNLDNKLCVKHKGTNEKAVSEYFNELAKLTGETSSLWNQIDEYVKTMGLNDWGYFCILRSLTEEIMPDVDNRVLFNFYILRNEGGFKVKTARGKDSNKLILLAAIDNSKEVYSYPFFRFSEPDGNKLKYYTVYGGGNPKESIYTYDYNEQDKDLKQIGLDFNSTLNMGVCDSKRELNFKKINSTIELPYNSAHIAYLNDVPMTVFPIYFASPISIEAQQVFDAKLDELKQQYSPIQFIDIMLNFVQTAFDYKTDEQQFGYEKYFYPEEVIAYPYSDCEDRSALFAWLVTEYTDAEVVGLQYEGHLATAVCFGNDVNISGDRFLYAGKRYYVCDPTYINASIGMTMPQFKNVTPEIIKMIK